MKALLLSLSLILLSSTSYAGDVTIRACRSKILNALSKIDREQKTNLEILEFKLTKPLNAIYENHFLSQEAQKSWVKEQSLLFQYPQRYFYRKPAVTKYLKENLFREIRIIGDVPNENFATLLEKNIIYNYVIQDEKITIAKVKPGGTIRDYASKHSILTAKPEDGKLRMSGEMWADEKNILHFNGNSGTYKPTIDDLHRTETFFKDYMGIKNLVLHPMVKKVETTPANTIIATKERPLDKAITTIIKLRPALLATKWTITQIKLKSLQDKKAQINLYMQDSHLTLNDSQGKKKNYIIRQLNDFTHQTTFLDPTSPQIPLAKESKEVIHLGIYPKPDKKNPHPHLDFIISLETVQTTGLNKKMNEFKVDIHESSSSNKEQSGEMKQLSDFIKNLYQLSDSDLSPGRVHP